MTKKDKDDNIRILNRNILLCKVFSVIFFLTCVYNFYYENEVIYSAFAGIILGLFAMGMDWLKDRIELLEPED